MDYSLTSTSPALIEEGIHITPFRTPGIPVLVYATPTRQHEWLMANVIAVAIGQAYVTFITAVRAFI